MDFDSPNTRVLLSKISLGIGIITLMLTGPFFFSWGWLASVAVPIGLVYGFPLVFIYFALRKPSYEQKAIAGTIPMLSTLTILMLALPIRSGLTGAALPLIFVLILMLIVFIFGVYGFMYVLKSNPEDSQRKSLPKWVKGLFGIPPFVPVIWLFWLFGTINVIITITALLLIIFIIFWYRENIIAWKIYKFFFVGVFLLAFAYLFIYGVIAFINPYQIPLIIRRWVMQMLFTVPISLLLAIITLRYFNIDAPENLYNN